MLTVPWLLTAAYLARLIPTHYPVPLFVAEVAIGLLALAGLARARDPRRPPPVPDHRRDPALDAGLPVLSFVGVQFYELTQSSQLAALYLPPVALASRIYLATRRGPVQPQAGAAGMSDSAALDSAALERRYRRLLAWFPAKHRRVYGEEMIGVLLASAPDGQDRPAAGEITNLCPAACAPGCATGPE